MNLLKRVSALVFALLLLTSSALAAKDKPTPTPAPVEITAEPAEPPEQIRHMLDIAYGNGPLSTERTRA